MPRTSPRRRPQIPARRAPAFLDDAALAAIRRAVAALTRPTPGVPMRALVELAASVASGPQVTLDLAATHELGAPLIVVHASRTSAPALLDRLSRREREVAALIAEGCRNAEIARRLHISLATVKDHVHHILEKTNLESRTALAGALANTGS